MSTDAEQLPTNGDRPVTVRMLVTATVVAVLLGAGIGVAGSAAFLGSDSTSAERGPAGPQGERGPKGERGARGPAGASSGLDSDELATALSEALPDALLEALPPALEDPTVTPAVQQASGVDDLCSGMQLSDIDDISDLGYNSCP